MAANHRPIGARAERPPRKALAGWRFARLAIGIFGGMSQGVLEAWQPARAADRAPYEWKCQRVCRILGGCHRKWNAGHFMTQFMTASCAGPQWWKRYRAGEA